MRFRITTQSCLFIEGEKQSGKSYLTAKLLSGLKRVLYVDPSADAKNLPSTWQRKQVFTSNQMLSVLDEAYKEGNVHIVLDDYDLFSAPLLPNDPEWRYLFVAARHRNIGWTVITRRLADVPKLALKQADYCFFFQTDLDQDLDVIEDQVQGGKQAAEAVRSLDRSRHQFFYWDRLGKQTGVGKA